MLSATVESTFNPSSTYKQTSHVVSNHRQRLTKASGARIRHRSRSVALGFTSGAFLRFTYWIGLASLLETRTAITVVACGCSLRRSVVGLLRNDSGGLIGRPGEDSDSDNAGKASGQATGNEGQRAQRCIGNDTAVCAPWR